MGMVTVGLGALANIILDPLFIFVFHMGVEGAAIATIIAQFLSALWVLFFLTGEKPPAENLLAETGIHGSERDRFPWTVQFLYALYQQSGAGSL